MTQKKSPTLPRVSLIDSDDLPTAKKTSTQQDVKLPREWLLPLTTTTFPLPALKNQLETLFSSISKVRPKSKPFSNPQKTLLTSNWKNRHLRPTRSHLKRTTGHKQYRGHAADFLYAQHIFSINPFTTPSVSHISDDFGRKHTLDNLLAS